MTKPIYDKDEDDRARSEIARREERREKQRITDLVWLMGDKRGRRIVWDLLSKSGVFRTVFNTNALQMAFNEGNRNYGLRVLADIQMHCQNQYSKMVEENKDDD